MQSDPPRTAAEIEKYLTFVVADALGVNPQTIDVNQSWDNYEINSQQGMKIALQVGEYLGLKLSPTILWYYPSINLLAQRLADEFTHEKSEKYLI
ncbi:acyl carrier protein [Calothrix sp. NIES-3974]|uniref:acyl carrier protein n=1 Tax=Calothrix sp. NIES-3974 TaxID=2005462 RepID=UPI000B5E8974|nr:acyl carrier protein [Calothrix sp. NIES-3974]BAZ06461.1 phosphopantetheine-binding protein [Calothrix sp. NIES-3974]